MRQVREPDLAPIRVRIKCSVRLKNRLVKFKGREILEKLINKNTKQKALSTLY